MLWLGPWRRSGCTRPRPTLAAGRAREAGEDIVIARNGTPVARVVPVVAPTHLRPFGIWRGQVEWPTTSTTCPTTSRRRSASVETAARHARCVVVDQGRPWLGEGARPSSPTMQREAAERCGRVGGCDQAVAREAQGTRGLRRCVASGGRTWPAGQCGARVARRAAAVASPRSVRPTARRPGVG